MKKITILWDVIAKNKPIKKYFPQACSTISIILHYYLLLFIKQNKQHQYWLYLIYAYLHKLGSTFNMNM